MKKAVAFLLAFLIFVAPMTTLVKADVVIGDNDETIMNENATILGRKLAMLESLSDLALSGVTEYTISNTTDVDSYLDSLWSEINDAIDYLDSGEWVDDIPSNIASKYYTNLVKYRDIVNNRGEFLGFDLQNPATSLLKTYFANDTYGKKYTSSGLYQTLDMVRTLSALTRGTSTPNPDPNYQSLLNKITTWKFIHIPNNSIIIPNVFIADTTRNAYGQGFYWNNRYNHTYVKPSGGFVDSWDTAGYNHYSIYMLNGVHTFYIDSDNNGYHIRNTSLTFTNSDFWSDAGVSLYCWNANYNGNYLTAYNLNNKDNYPNFSIPNTTFLTLESCLEYLVSTFKYFNLYVDNVPWILLDDLPRNPTLDIDGYLKLYGNDNPPQYELKPNTYIDYDELYHVIYNAIHDNLPISQGDITYYDSHDTIYSPTIINNYGDEDGNESDLIDTILNYAVIPSFDVAIAQPMRQALTNGVVIMNNSISNVIPQEILFILGACFFLLLFAVVINRMIK